MNEELEDIEYLDTSAMDEARGGSTPVIAGDMGLSRAAADRMKGEAQATAPTPQPTEQPRPMVTGSIVLEDIEPLGNEAPAIDEPVVNREVPASALSTVDSRYSDTLDQISSTESELKADYTRQVSAIMANVPKRLQQRYLARTQAQFNEAAALIELKRSQIGGQIYEKLDDNTRLVADDLRQRGLGAIQAAKMADKSERVKRIAQDMLSEFANNPEMHDALSNKLYGRASKDASGRITREGGLIQTNNFGALDVVNEGAFENIYKDVEAQRADRRKSRGGASRGSTKNPLDDALGDVQAAIGVYNTQLEKMADSTDTEAIGAIKSERDALFTRYRELLNQKRSSSEAAIQGLDVDTSMPSEGNLRPTMQREAIRKEDRDVKTHEGAISDLYKKATTGVNDADGRKNFTTALTDYAATNKLPTITVKTTEDLKKLASITKPTIVVEEGRVGAGTGLTAKVMDRGAFQQWAAESLKPEVEAKHTEISEKAKRAASVQFSKIRSLLPYGDIGNLKLDRDNRIVGASGDAKDIMDRYPQLFENYNAAVAAGTSAKQNLDRIAMLREATGSK